MFAGDEPGSLMCGVEIAHVYERGVRTRKDQ